MTQRTPGEIYDPAQATYSNTIQVGAANTSLVALLNAKRLAVVPGLATVMIQADIPSPDATRPSNRKLIAQVRYGSGKGQGTALVDCTNGSTFTCAGTNAIDISVQQAKVDPVAAFAGDAWNVSAIAHWNTSVNPKPAYMTSDSVTFAGAGTSPRIAIPTRAARGTITVEPFADLATMTLRYFGDANGASRAVAAITAPNPTQLLPTVAGARFFDLVYTGAAAPRVVAIWELWL